MTEKVAPEFRGAGGPSKPDMERLLEIQVVKDSIKDIAEWAADPKNQMARLVKAVVDTGDPEGVLKEMDPEEVLKEMGLEKLEVKDHPAALLQMARGFNERVGEILAPLSASLYLLEDRELIYAWSQVISHELATPLSITHRALEGLARPAGIEAILGNAQEKALKGSLLLNLVLKNFQVLDKFGVFEEGLEKAIAAIEVNSISNPMFNKAMGEVLAYSKKIMGDNLIDETGISGAGEPDIQVADSSRKEEVEHLFFNLMVNMLAHGERNTQVVVRKTDDGAIEIENQIKTRSPIVGIDHEEYVKQLESLVTQEGLVFNGRDLKQYSKMPWQGLGVGLTVARILAAKLGLSIEHRVEGNKVIARVSQVDAG